MFSGLNRDPKTKLILMNGGTKTRNNSAAVTPAMAEPPVASKIEIQQSLAIAPFLAILLFRDILVPTKTADRRMRVEAAMK